MFFEEEFVAVPNTKFRTQVGIRFEILNFFKVSHDSVLIIFLLNEETFGKIGEVEVDF